MRSGSSRPVSTQSRARLSFKRRPPTRQHRRSAGEEAGASGTSPSPCEPDGPTENGDEAQVFDNPAQGPADGQGSFPPNTATLKEPGEDEDCATTEDNVPENAPTNRADSAFQEGQVSREQEVAQALDQGAMKEESQQSLAPLRR